MIQIPNPKIPAVAAAGTEPFAPEQIVENLRLLRQHVPDFGPLPVPSAKSLRTTAAIPAELVLASINTVGASQHIAAAITTDAPTLLAEREDVARWSAVEDELRTMLEGVAAANLARRHRLGLAALQTYSIARQLVRKKEHADLLPHVENMRRANRFGRRRTPPQKVTPPQPAPVPVPTAPVKAP
jgi:hypothetical protein